jgi:hypothetical protein
MGYSGTFRFNQEKNDFEPGKTLTTDDTDNTDLHGSEVRLAEGRPEQNGIILRTLPAYRWRRSYQTWATGLWTAGE